MKPQESPVYLQRMRDERWTAKGWKEEEGLGKEIQEEKTKK